MKFWGAFLEHFGILFGTKNGQKRHQNMTMKKVKEKDPKQIRHPIVRVKPFLTWEREARFFWKLSHVRVYQ